MAASLSSHLFRRNSLQSYQHISTSLHGFADLSALIPHLPLEYRKAIITACRLRLDENQLHPHLDSIFYDLDPFMHNNDIINIDAFYQQIRTISAHPISGSILLSFALTEQILDLGTCSEVLYTGAVKEFSAAMILDHAQILNYNSFLYNQGTLSILSSPHPALSRRFITFLDRFKSEVSSVKFPPILPTFGKKTVARSTAEELSRRLGLSTVDYRLSTHDLEKYYSETGETIPGPSELRTSWKYGDLKARIYYAMGGTHYFASRYVPYISYRLTHMLECTNPKTRYDVSRLDTNPFDDGDMKIVLVTYDYKSFTTTLSELKFFLNFLSDYFKGTLVPLMDLHTGPRYADLGELLEEYNDVCVKRPKFDTLRLAELLGVEDIFSCSRGGLLGTNGNINLSLLLHGLHLSSFDDKDSTKSVVGDDALAKVSPDRLPDLVQHVNDLIPLPPPDLSIHPDKFSLLLDEYNLPEADIEGAFPYPSMYLKAPLTFSGSEIRLSRMLPFPNMSLVFGLHSQFRTTLPTTLSAMVHKFISQLHGWLTMCNRMYSGFGDEFDSTDPFEDSFQFKLVRYLFSKAYRRLGLPLTGALPGTKVKVWHTDNLSSSHKYSSKLSSSDKTRGLRKKAYQNVRLVLLLPDILNPRSYTDDWISTTMENLELDEVLLPIYSEVSRSGGRILGVGHSFTCTPHRIQRIAEDYGFLVSEIEYKLYVMKDFGQLESMMRRIMMAGLRPLVRYTCIVKPPDWYNQYIDTFQHLS